MVKKRRLRYCTNCQKEVTPTKKFNVWPALLVGVLPYLLVYHFWPTLRCPICHGTELEDVTAVHTLKAKPHVQMKANRQKGRFFCRYCGAENKADAIFCDKCGKKIA
jgi:ribosomal protein L40E